MIKRIICLGAALSVLTAAFSSCGQTVKLADISSTQPSARAASAETTDSEAERTEDITEPATEPVTEPVLFEIDITPPDGYSPSGSCVISDFETVLQEPELPTGCEVTSLAQTLNYLGFPIDKVELADEFMPIDFNGRYTMDEAYIGEPKSDSGMGCLAPVIVQTADDYFESIESPCYAEDLSETSLAELFYQIDQGRPVIVWITMYLRVSSWYYQYTAVSGDEMWFNYYQHCVTLYGYDYDEGVVYIADPLVGNTTYDMAAFENVYDIMKQQAVVICGDSSTEGTFLPRPDKPDSGVPSRNHMNGEDEPTEYEDDDEEYSYDENDAPGDYVDDYYDYDYRDYEAL